MNVTVRNPGVSCVQGGIAVLAGLEAVDVVIQRSAQVVAMSNDWNVESGQIILHLVNGDHVTLVYDADDGGLDCSEALGLLQRWLSGS